MANIYAHLDYSSKVTSAQAMADVLELPDAGNFGSKWLENATEQTAQKLEPVFVPVLPENCSF